MSVSQAFDSQGRLVTASAEVIESRVEAGDLSRDDRTPEVVEVAEVAEVDDEFDEFDDDEQF